MIEIKKQNLLNYASIYVLPLKSYKIITTKIASSLGDMLILKSPLTCIQPNPTASNWTSK
jgi:hypothetical protein